MDEPYQKWVINHQPPQMRLILMMDISIPQTFPQVSLSHDFLVGYFHFQLGSWLVYFFNPAMSFRVSTTSPAPQGRMAVAMNQLKVVLLRHATRQSAMFPTVPHGVNQKHQGEVDVTQEGSNAMMGMWIYLDMSDQSRGISQLQSTRNFGSMTHLLIWNPFVGNFVLEITHRNTHP